MLQKKEKKDIRTSSKNQIRTRDGIVFTTLQASLLEDMSGKAEANTACTKQKGSHPQATYSIYFAWFVSDCILAHAKGGRGVRCATNAVSLRLQRRVSLIYVQNPALAWHMLALARCTPRQCQRKRMRLQEHVQVLTPLRVLHWYSYILQIARSLCCRDAIGLHVLILVGHVPN